MSSNRRNQFYLTLPSNSSLDYYPNNTVANYVTHLPTSIHLTGDGGDWEIALVEAHYPCSFLTVCNDATIFIYSKPTIDHEEAAAAAVDVTKVTALSVEPGNYKDIVMYSTDDKKAEATAVEASVISKLTAFKVEPGNYKDIDELLLTINADSKLKQFNLEFQHDKTTGKVELISMKSDVLQIELSPTLALQMGYDLNNNNVKINRKATRPPNLLAGIPSHMYVYCDLVDPQLVGDTVAPLLKIVNIDMSDYTYGSHKIVHFNDPHYVPVIKSMFESVEVDLRDSRGEKLPFQFGTTCMKLHLRQAAAAR